MKYIRELRMGPGKQWKTGAVVSSYPKPMLCFNFDQGGLDVIDQPIQYIPATELEPWCLKKPEELPPILAIDFSAIMKRQALEAYNPQAAKEPFKAYVRCINMLITKGCPWKTNVHDSCSGIGDFILNDIAETNSSSLGSALKWAPMIGQKIHQLMGVAYSTNSHVVFICHTSEPDKDETLGTISRKPLVPSQWLRDRITTLGSQVLFQIVEGGKPIVCTTNNDALFVKGLGCRWPKDLPAKCPADYKSIYETTYSKK